MRGPLRARPCAASGGVEHVILALEMTCPDGVAPWVADALMTTVPAMITRLPSAITGRVPNRDTKRPEHRMPITAVYQGELR
ncbi:hypothetical protein AQJ46_00325 [Streptomyces canus]|uniref:Uncharacterized protein n=1 Tax=Streptomyces canus TaxID=58343 RepID=A0A101SGX9_9ACTN|nr:MULTISPECIES: hypothetical protein [Streptomyces]KUN74079.1 hypothetical protein AQJ46_00325 [Streptomyces canus]MDI5911955.1 hypothetical protein [Streptomyces sp. 12257]